MMRNSRRTFEQLEQRQLLSSIPVLNSFPSATHTIFLDFDGHPVTDTIWNVGRDVIHASPFDADGIKYDYRGNVTFSADEIARMVSIWERMSEDFRPFNVNVTTVDPSISDPSVFDRDGVAQRVLFTSKFDQLTGERWFQGDALGYARVESWYRDNEVVWVFSTDAIGAGEVGSHEVGHALGLHHDGIYLPDGSVNEYRGSHGAGQTRWSPIMGQGNGLTQWSAGEYPNATNQELDVGLLARGLGWRSDDYGSIQPLAFEDQGRFSLEGIIGSRGDTDIFSFELTAPVTTVRIEARPWHNGPNLDIELTLFENTRPIHRQNPNDALAASLEDLRLGPGMYFLSLDGVGKPATDDDPGYSDYGSLGHYQITGQIGEPLLRGDVNGDAKLDAQDIDLLYSSFGQVASSDDDQLRADLNQDRSIDQLDVDVLVHEIFRTKYGDFDLDRDVDFEDFLVLSASFGKQGVGWTEGNATADDEVAFEDFLLLAVAFGFEGT